MVGTESTCEWSGQRVHVSGRDRKYMSVVGTESTCKWPGQRVHVSGLDFTVHIY